MAESESMTKATVQLETQKMGGWKMEDGEERVWAGAESGRDTKAMTKISLLM